MTFNYEVTLGLPHTNRRGFWEPDVMKQAGHCQWQAIATALGRPLSELRTVGGGEIYAAFYYIEIRVPDTAPLESFNLDDTVRFTIALRAFKNISIEGQVRMGIAGAPPADAGPEIRFANIFITPVKGNSELRVAPPAGVESAAIPRLPNAENPFHLTRAARDEGTLRLFGDGWAERSGSFTYSYQIDRDRDTNGAGLVYFANYLAFTDAAERAIEPAGGVVTGERSLRHRRVAYYGNADIDDRLTVLTSVWVDPRQPSRIGYRHIVRRDSDAALICLTEVIKATERAIEFR